MDAGRVVELASGHRVLTDRGAAAEFASSLTEGLRAHVEEIAARTGARVLVQLDEPSLPAVIAGSLPTASGYGTVRAVREPDAADRLREVIAGLGVPVVVHCCADRPPIRLLASTGAAAVGIDATRPAFSGGTAIPAALDAIGETWDAGVPMMLGMLPSTAAGLGTRRSATWPAPGSSWPTASASAASVSPASPSRPRPAGSPARPRSGPAARSDSPARSGRRSRTRTRSPGPVTGSATDTPGWKVVVRHI